MNKKFKLSFVVKYHRKLNGYTQKELADLAGVGKTVIFDLEKGKETVGFNIITKILRALKLNIFIDTPHEKDKIQLKT